MPVAMVIASGPNRADNGTASAMVQGSASVSRGVLNQTPMGVRAGTSAWLVVAGLANVADGVKARAPRSEEHRLNSSHSRASRMPSSA